MAHIHNAAAAFAGEALAGIVAANADTIVAANGGAAVRVPSSSRRVSVVTGGGSGYYPAFAGFVGDGVADASGRQRLCRTIRQRDRCRRAVGGDSAPTGFPSSIIRRTSHYGPSGTYLPVKG